MRWSAPSPSGGAEPRRVVVTGAAGFIGSHLVERLATRGCSVVAVDDLSHGDVANMRGFPAEVTTVDVDVRDVDALLDAVGSEADAFVHLAGVLGAHLVASAPETTLLHTIDGARAAIAAADRLGSRLFVASTSEVYGDVEEQPLSETQALRILPPSNPRASYALAKGSAELLALAAASRREPTTVVGRLFNTIGPRQNLAYGAVVSTFMRAALRDEPLRVHGDGSQTRTFTSVHDAVADIDALVWTRTAHGRIVNIGGDIECSILELAHAILDVTGSSSPIVHVAYEDAHFAGATDVRRRVPDLAVLSALTGTSSRTPLRVALAEIARAMRGADA